MGTKPQSASIALLAEFEGVEIKGRTIAILSSRIDALIRVAVSTERQRCAAVAKGAWIATLGDGEHLR